MVWSMENAMTAYLRTLETVTNKFNEPNVASFIAILAAGNGAKLVVEACSGPAGQNTLALVAAVSQNGGCVICILPGNNELQASIDSLGLGNSPHLKFVVGNAEDLLAREYTGADFVVIDCQMDGYYRVSNAARDSAIRNHGGFVLEYNILCHQQRNDDVCDHEGVRAELLPIGGGLRIWKMPPGVKRRQWIIWIDEETGEEHVVRILPHERITNKV